MLGVGFQEMFLIMVVALVIFGPGRLPEVAGQVGRAVRDFRRMTADLTGEFEKTIAEVDDVKQSVRKEVTSMRAEVEGVTKSVKADLEGIGETKAVAAGGGAKKAATAKGGGGRTAAKAAVADPAPGDGTVPTTATKADPLADVSALDATETLPAEPAEPEKGIPISADGVPAPAAASEPSVDEGEPAGEGTDALPTEEPVLAGVGAGADDAVARARRRRATAGYRRI
jgi:Tat protein translocase TatB subunit